MRKSQNVVTPSVAKLPEISDNMRQAAAVLGIPFELVSGSKAAGAPAFVLGGRIRNNELRDWLADPEHRAAAEAQAKGDKTSLKDKLTTEQIRRLRIANRAKSGQLISRQVIAAAMAKCAAAVKGVLRTRLENEYPTFVAGLAVPEARVFGKRLADEVIKEFAALADLFQTGRDHPAEAAKSAKPGRNVKN